MLFSLLNGVIISTRGDKYNDKTGNEVITFDITTKNIQDGTYEVEVKGLPDDVEVKSVSADKITIEIKDDKGKLILKGKNTMTKRFSSDKLTLTIDSTESPAFKMRVGNGPAEEFKDKQKLEVGAKSVYVGKQTGKLRSKNYYETVIRSNIPGVGTYDLEYFHIKEGTSAHLYAGQLVKAGTPIGVVGTSYGFDVHLHLQVLNTNEEDPDINNAPRRIDPLRLFDFDVQFNFKIYN